MGFLQQFHVVIKYKKGIHNKVADMLSRPPTNSSIVIQKITRGLCWMAIEAIVGGLDNISATLI